MHACTRLARTRNAPYSFLRKGGVCAACFVLITEFLFLVSQSRACHEPPFFLLYLCRARGVREECPSRLIDAHNLHPAITEDLTRFGSKASRHKNSERSRVHAPGALSSGRRKTWHTERVTCALRHHSRSCLLLPFLLCTAFT